MSRLTAGGGTVSKKVQGEYRNEIGTLKTVMNTGVFLLFLLFYRNINIIHSYIFSYSENPPVVIK